MNQSIFRKRKRTLKKKAKELSILCEVPVCLFCFEPDGKLDTWPEDNNKVDDILLQYARRQNLILPEGFLDPKNEKQDWDIKNKKVYETWDSRLDYLPEESLMHVLESLDHKAKILEQRMRVKKIEEKGKGIQINDDDDDGISSSSNGASTS